MFEDSSSSNVLANDSTIPPVPLLEGIQALLVEDEADMADLLTFMLEEYGAAVIHVDSATAALSVLEQQEPNILICNIKLPDQDGTWLIQHIREERQLNRTIPAIAVTSYTREFSIQRAFEAGFQQFLTKPIDPYDLVAAILHLL
jgi:CheY-like chemotaxis protein